MRSRAASISLNVTTSLALEGCLSRCQSRNGNPKWAATHVIQTEPVTEFDAHGFAAVFAANPQLDVRPSLASQVARNFHQAPNAFLIDRRKRIRIQNIKFRVDREKTTRIVPAHSERRLCEIVCAKAEELRVARDQIGDECGARGFNHCPDEINESRFLFLCHFVGNAPAATHLKLSLAPTPHQP